MDQPSAFQAQYPLSPKKFWKKQIDKLPFFILLSLLVGAPVGFGVGVMTLGESSTASIWPVVAIAMLGFAAVLVLCIAIYGIYVRAYIKRYYYDCGPDFVTIQKGVFAPTEIHVQYQKIQDVYVDQDIVDRFMGLYDVHIASATYTSGMEAHIDGVEKPVAEALKNLLLEKIRHGGTPAAPAPGAPAVPSAPSVPRPTGVQFSQKISSGNYPISSSWFVSIIFSSAVYSLVLSWILSSWVTGILIAVNPQLLDSRLTVFLGVFFVVVALRMVWYVIWKKNFYFEFEPDYVLLKTGVVSREEKHVPYRTIQNVSTSQGIVERMLGIATVYIENAAQAGMPTQRRFGGLGRPGITLVGQPLPKANELTQILNDVVKRQTNTQGTGL